MLMGIKETISLHGLGFLQVILPKNPAMPFVQRMHIWHPALPRRSCWEHTSIHDHRFGFTSRVLVGTQINRNYLASEVCVESRDRYYRYRHDGDRTKFGNRPWDQYGAPVEMIEVQEQAIHAGGEYHMMPFVFHSTEAGADGRVATLMTKTYEHPSRGASSTCRIGHEPDVNFDRYQMSTDDMWNIVREVLGG